MKQPRRRKTRAARLAVPVPTCAPHEPTAALLARLAGSQLAVAEPICIVDADRRLLGQAHLIDVLRAEPDRPVIELCDPRLTPVLGDADEERVAGHALAQHAVAVAVVDHQRRLLGGVPARALMEILRREHIEDVHRLAGVAREAAHDPALSEPPRRRVRHRLPWLLAGLAGSAAATWVTANFEDELRTNVAIAFFIPAIVYMADAIGTQTEAIAVRHLSLGHRPARVGKLITGEIATGAMLGAALGLLALAGALLAFADARLAVAVAFSIFAAGVLAALMGLLLPWVLQRHGFDPAFGSGPLATVIQDILSLLVYLACVALLM